METGDRRTEDGGRLTRSEENVIRLPRDWLGPPEELVPIGPAARARAALRDAEAGMPPAADAFWSEDSAALHNAVQAPSAVSRERRDPPAGLVPPVAGLRTPGLGRLPQLRSFAGESRVSRWWGLVAIPILALAVVAVIGSTEGPASHPAARQASASHSLAAAGSTSTSATASGNAAADKFRAQVKERQQHASGRGYTRTRTRTRAARPRPAKPHHRAPAHHSATVHDSAASSARTITEAPAPASNSSAPASTTPSASTASTSSSVGSKRATGPPGPTRIGSFSGGCLPKCSS